MSARRARRSSAWNVSGTPSWSSRAGRGRQQGRAARRRGGPSRSARRPPAHRRSRPARRPRRSAPAPRNESASAMWSPVTASAPSSAAIVRATRRARSAPRPESSIWSTARPRISAAAGATRRRLLEQPPSRGWPRGRPRRRWARRRRCGRRRGGLDAQVEAVEQRPREPRPVGVQALRRADALAVGVAREAARARVHRRDDACTRAGRRTRPRAPRHQHLAVLERASAAPRARSRLNSGSSSRNRTPRWASADLARPQAGAAHQRRRRMPCGAARGTARLVEPRTAARAAPAAEWIRVISSTSARGRAAAGSRCRRRASIVLPEPGGPVMSRLCAPAAAISSARRARGWPRTSARSATAAARRRRRRRDRVGAGRARARMSTTWRRLRAAIARHRARQGGLGGALRGDDERRRRPACRAASAIASAPRTGRRAPSSPSSAAAATRATRSRGAWPDAASSASAIARSNPEPSLRSWAGARLTVSRRRGSGTRPRRCRCARAGAPPAPPGRPGRRPRTPARRRRRAPRRRPGGR